MVLSGFLNGCPIQFCSRKKRYQQFLQKNWQQKKSVFSVKEGFKTLERGAGLKSASELSELDLCFDIMSRFRSVSKRIIWNQSNPNALMKKEINNTRATKRGAAIEREITQAQDRSKAERCSQRMSEFNALWCFHG